MKLKALFTFSGRVSVKRDPSNEMAGDRGIASALAEEADTAGEDIEVDRKLTEKVNSSKLKPYLLSLLATMFPNALGFLAFPLYAKALGPSDYGIVALLEAYQGILSILLFLGMSTAFYVFYSHAKNKEEQKEVFATSAYFGLTSLAFAIAVALFSRPISFFLFSDDAAAAFIAIYAFALFSDYMLTLMNTYLRVEGQIAFLAFNAIIISLVHHGLSFYAVVLSGGGIAEFITIFFITKSVALLMVAFHIKRLKLPLNRKFALIPLLNKMLKFGAPLILTALTGWVLLLSDRLFINYYVTTADVGIYAVAYKFAMGLWIGIVQPFMTVWEPSLFRSYIAESLQGYAKLKRDFTRYLAGIVILYSAFILFIKEVLDFIFVQSDYTHEGNIIYLLAASYFLMAVGEMCASVCRLHKTSKFAIWVALAVISTKLIFNVTLIPSYLLIGAAAASVIAEVVSQTIMARFAVGLSKPHQLFFSLRNWLLAGLFALSEGLLFFVPDASFLLKSLFFTGLLCTSSLVVLLAEKKPQMLEALN